MDTSSWHRVKEIIEAALARPPTERSRFVLQMCGDDSSLREEVESLLVAIEQAGNFIERPPLQSLSLSAVFPAGWIPDLGGRALEPGNSLGPYTIREFVGAGGMGEVYRAHDANLNRDVALKVRPAAFALDADRFTRFRHEAHMLAALNHPNIAAIYGLEDSDGVQALVLELVEGPTLASRIARGRIPISEALTIAKQIAEGLEAAHKRGIIHSDLKPANIKLRPDGAVKILDFGLAKALDAVDASSAVSDAAPFTSSAVSHAGPIFGTAAYMSPEQARGETVDKRTDVWAFGCVLFEMLSGHGTFGGRTVSDVIASVLKTDPDWSSLPVNLDPRILHLLERCLEKEPQDRSQGLADARFEINKVLANPGSGLASPPIQTRAGLRSRLPWIAAIVVAAVVAVVAWIPGRAVKPTEPARVVKLPFVLPEGQGLGDYVSMMTISPDGTRIAYATDGGLYLRDLDKETEPWHIPGSQGQGATQPEFSPDGEWLAFTTGGPINSTYSLKKIPVSGGTPVPLIENSIPGIVGLSWTENDTIMFSGNGIREIPAAGGIPRVLIERVEGVGLSGPELLPGGTSLMFSVRTTPGSVDSAKIVVQDLRSGSRQIVWHGGIDARYIPTGHIVYVQGHTLFAIPFDLDRLKTVGGPVAVIEGVRRSTIGTATGHYDVSDNGSLVYLPGRPISPLVSLLALVDRKGGRQMLNVPLGHYKSPRFSPDGTQLTVEVIADDGKHSIWIYSLTGAFDFHQLTQTGYNTHAIWTPDSKSVTFASNSDGMWKIYSQRADESAGPELLTAGEPGIKQLPESWSRDGLTLSFVKDRPGDSSLWTLSMETKTSRLFHDDKGFDDFGSAFSPDGEWLAYTVTANPAPGIRVQPFPPTGQIYKLTEKGESWPVWSTQGNELFFRTDKAELVGMDLSTKGNFGFGNKRPLPVGNVLMDRNFRDYDITPDGKKFVMIVPAKAPVPAATSPPAPRPRAQINIVQNWSEELKTRVPPR